MSRLLVAVTLLSLSFADIGARCGLGEGGEREGKERDCNEQTGHCAGFYAK